MGEGRFAFWEEEPVNLLGPQKGYAGPSPEDAALDVRLVVEEIPKDKIEQEVIDAVWAKGLDIGQNGESLLGEDHRRRGFEDKWPSQLRRLISHSDYSDPLRQGQYKSVRWCDLVIS